MINREGRAGAQIERTCVGEATDSLTHVRTKPGVAARRNIEFLGPAEAARFKNRHIAAVSDVRLASVAVRVLLITDDADSNIAALKDDITRSRNASAEHRRFRATGHIDSQAFIVNAVQEINHADAVFNRQLAVAGTNAAVVIEMPAVAVEISDLFSAAVVIHILQKQFV